MRTKTVFHRLYQSVFLSRRLLYAILIVVCMDNPNIHIHVFLLSNIIYIVYLGYTGPNELPISRRMEFFNESGLQLVTYHLALFPLLSVDDETRFGWSMVGFVGLIFVGNLIVMIILTIKGLIRKLHLKKLRRLAIAKYKAEQEKKLNTSATAALSSAKYGFLSNRTD